jgi:hypothetical protein
MGALSARKTQRSVVQELPTGTCVKLLLRISGSFFSLNLSIAIGIQMQCCPESGTVMRYMRRRVGLSVEATIQIP